MKTIRFKVTGTTALMLNNPQTVNPFNEYSKMLKPLTSKRTKTEDDMKEIFRLKFISSLYISDGVYIIPSSHFEKSICEAAKERKLKTKFEMNLHALNDCPIDFKDKDKTPEQLYELEEYVDIRNVGIQKSKIATARAIIPQWETKVEFIFDDTQIDEKDVCDIFEIAGKRYGIGTYRRLYGKFEIKKMK